MNTMRMHRAPAGGFTLMELLVVIVIIAILVAFALPNFQGLVAENRTASELNDLTGDMALARSAAIKQGVTVTICASANPIATTPACSGTSAWGTGWIIFTDMTGDQTYGGAAAGDTLLRIHAGLQSGDTLTGSAGTAGLPSVTFNRMGGTASFAAPTSGMLTLHDANNDLAWRRCLELSMVGASTQSTAGACP